MLRPQLAAAAEVLSSDGQFGSGLHAGSTDVAHLVFQNLFAAAARQRVCAVAVFVDVATAFPSRARRLVLPTASGDEAWLHTIRCAGFTPEEAEEIRQEAVSIISWGRAGASSHTVAMVAALHDFTWAHGEGLEKLLVTRRGTLAGTAVADIVFVVAIGMVHRRLFRQLAAHGLVADVYLEEARSLCPQMLADAPLS